jgi:hypothetical protein
MIDVVITTAWLASLILLSVPLMRFTLRVVLFGSFLIADGFASLTPRRQSFRCQTAECGSRERNVAAFPGRRVSVRVDLNADGRAAA